MSFVPLRKGDIAIGKPLPWAIYDQEHNLLLQRGYVLETQNQLETLLEKGLCRRMRQSVEPLRGTAAGTRSAEMQEQSDSSQQERALDDIKLQIGDTLQLQAQVDQGTERYYVKLVGYVKNVAVLVTTPVVDGKVLLIRDGQTFVVRAFCGKSAFAFQASVLKSVSTPFAHLCLTYPKSVRGLVIRKGARVNTKIITAVSVLDGLKKGEAPAATITNLSTTGALLAARSRVGDKGDRLAVKFRLFLNGIESYLTVDAVIRNIQEDPPVEGVPQQVSHGIEFVDMQQQDLIMLTAYVYQQLLKDVSED